MPYKTSPLSGYPGGKYKLLKYIIPLIHNFPFEFYAEPFAGGAAVFFGIEKYSRKSYVLNDLNDQIINFYLQAKNNQEELIALARSRGIVSNQLHAHSRAIFTGEVATTELETAWAMWYLMKTSWQHIFDKPYYPHLRTSNNLHYSLLELEKMLGDMRYVSIEKLDAIKFIKQYDAEDTLFYLDPPYVSTSQHHYRGYKQADLDALLEALVEVKGGFVFSHYNHQGLREWASAHGFRYETMETRVSLAMATNGKAREEILIYNFPRKNLV